MKNVAKTWTRFLGLVEKHPILFGALLIFGYYLFLTFNLYERPAAKQGALGFVMQFDSLLLLWGVVYVLIQLQKFRKERADGEQHQRRLLLEYQRQQLQLSSLDDISDMLNDRINNPLAVIALSAGSLRERTTTDDALAHDVDKIESSLKRVQEIMMGIQSYHTKKIIKLSKELLKA